MSIGEAKERRDKIRARMYDISATLAEMKRAYVVDKIPSDLATRTTLEAEYAALRKDLDQLDVWLHGQKKAEEALKKSDLTSALIRLLHSRGLGELVREAQRMASDAAIRAAALFTPAPEAAAS